MEIIHKRKVIITTGYGTAWKENDKIKVRFTSLKPDQPVYDITDLDLPAAIGYDDLTKVLGSWGPTNELKMFLEKRMAK